MRLLFLAVASILLVSAQEDELRTRLVGFDGCDAADAEDIRRAWRDSRPVMDLIREITINWNEAAALEYLGPPGYNRDGRAAIQDILRNLGTITGTGIPTPFDWRIRVRCDDWLNACGLARYRTEAYTRDEDERYITTINFCNEFFAKLPLSEAINRGRQSRDPAYKFNMERYDDTTGIILIHELLHINWVHKSGRYGTNQPVIDYRIRFWDPVANRWEEEDVYGARMAKILARYRDPDHLGGILARSDENLGLYALAKYVQSQLGAYPHRPVVDTSPSEHPWYQSVDSPFVINATGGINSNSSMADPQPFEDFSTEFGGFYSIEQFIPESDLPADYVALWKGWTQDGVGLTNLHINNYDGWIRTVALSEPTGSKDVVVKKGDTVGVFDGWVTYWTLQCPNTSATFMWEESYGDVFLEADGYMHDSGGAQIGQIQLECNQT